jgi:3-hydroxybutyryl-CoA dehydrogenase
MALHRIGVIGAGNIGVGVVTDLTLKGIPSQVIDLSDTILERAKGEILRNIRFAPLFSKGLPRLSKEEALKLMTFSSDIQTVSDCDFVIENVTEDWAIKKEVYFALDRVMAAQVCFGCNTSCISITRVGALTRRPDRVVGMHLMNPVHLQPTVEVIRGYHTSDATIATLQELFAMLNKEAIVVEDLPGFVSNRISHLFMNEAAFVVQDQVATPEKVDAIFKKCFHHRMGPLETADLIGLDTVVRSLDVLYESYQDPKFRCCPLLRKMVHAGHLGRKTGKGFYTYPE